MPQPVARVCPFCLGVERRAFGVRKGAVFVRCLSCAAVYMDISAQEYSQLHDGHFEDNAFIADITAMHGAQPDHDAWREFSAWLPDGSVLEIGPGTGHVLAAAQAAGRHVAGVEASATHRRFIQQTWGIERVVAKLSELPPGERYDNVVMINVVEHVYDVIGLMTELRAHLAKNARVFVSTVNGRGILGSLAGTYWSMFKERDHVSFPSGDSLQRLAAASGYTLRRRWSTELPFETPIGLLVAARDFVRERRAATQVQGRSRFAEQSSTGAVSSDPARERKKKWLAQFYVSSRRVDLTRHAVGALERAATIKGLFVPSA